MTLTDTWTDALSDELSTATQNSDLENESSEVTAEVTGSQPQHEDMGSAHVGHDADDTSAMTAEHSTFDDTATESVELAETSATLADDIDMSMGASATAHASMMMTSSSMAMTAEMDDMSGMDDMMMHGHSVDDIAPLSEMTHVAVNDGDWSDPKTWSTGTVPGAEANVHVPEGLSVTFDMKDTPPLGVVRVDGNLTWATDMSTKMLVETIATSHGSHLDVGASANGLNNGYTAEIVFRDTPIDMNADPEMLTHGLVAMGQVEIQGAAKETHLEIAGNSVKAGATSVKLEGDMTNWKVGDTILFVGTGDGSRDEQRTITSIDGNTVTFDTKLNYNHEPPAGQDFDTYVGNLSQNIIFSSENPEGTRGHVMLMNSMTHGSDYANVVMYAEFDELGRTDQSIITGTSANPEGRYPLHLHQTGTDPDSAYSLIEGVSVSGAPGWGIVQHSSAADILNSIVFDTVGAGMVSEWGDEVGTWMGNLVTSVAGTDVDSHAQPGSEGAAYENQSRVIIQQYNIAANSEIGWNFFGREDFPEDEDNPSAPKDGSHREMFEREQMPYDPSPFDVALDHEEPPITDFVANVAMGTGTGFRVFHRQFSDDTDTMSLITDFTVWASDNAVELDNYASNYMFMDSTWQGDGIGFSIQRKTSSVVFNNVEMIDFDTAYKSWGVNHEVVLIDTTFVNVDEDFYLDDLLRNVDNASTANELIAYYKNEHGLDYENPMPLIVSSDDLKEIEAVYFTPDSDADLSIGKNDRTIDIRGTITDSVGVRNYNEYVIAKPPNGSGSSKDFEGVSITFATSESDSQKEFTVDQFLELHGTWQNQDGSWVTPVVNWINDRLTGDYHPVIIEVELKDFDKAYLEAYELDAYPNPGINNPAWYEENDVFGEDTGTDDDEPVDDPDDEPVDDPDDEPVDDPDDEPVDDPDDEPVDDPDDEPVDDPDDDETDLPETTHMGTDGKDTLVGTKGDDVLEGGAAKDSLTGGAGADIFRFGADALDGSRDDVIDFSIGEGDMIDLSLIAAAYGFTADEMSDLVAFKDIKPGLRISIDLDGETYAFAVLHGIAYSDFDADAQVIYAAGTTGDDDDEPVIDPPVIDPPVEDPDDDEPTVEDPPVVDTPNVILGTTGKDTLTGTKDDDILEGGASRDTLTGAAGADTFVFNVDALDGTRDDIMDFSMAEGDTIDLSLIAEAYGFSEADMFDQLLVKDISIGLRLSLEIKGEVHHFAALNGVSSSDITVSDVFVMV